MSDLPIGGLVAVVGVLAIPALAWREVWLAPLPFLGAGLLLAAARAARIDRDRRRRERVGDSICTFAREFGRREVDTRVLRAVWNELEAWWPIRATDRLRIDLQMGEPDLDIGWFEVAAAAGRTLDGYEDNLWYGQIETVADVVRFLNAQPRAAA